MGYFLLRPDVPASFAPGAVFDRSSGSLTVVKAVLLWEGSLGGDIFKLSPIFFVTTRLASALEASELTGFEVQERLEVLPSETFIQLVNLEGAPVLFRLEISGGKADDMFLFNGKLVVSQKALDLLTRFSIRGTDVEVFDN